MSVGGVASLAVDPTFMAFGHAANYRDQIGSAPVGCLVIMDTADRAVGAGSHFAAGAASPIAMGVIFQLRKSEVANPKKGDRITIEGVVYKIISAPRFDDPERLVFTFTVDPQPQSVAASTLP